MNKISPALIVALAVLTAAPAFAQSNPPASTAPASTSGVKAPPAPRPRTSPHETVNAYVGGDRRTGTLITITYGRPYTTKPGTSEARKIWGGLVPWDKADRLGSDEATLLVTPLPLVIGETTVPAGAYTLYIVPSENGASKLAFSSNIGKWGIPVDEKHDVARVDLKKDDLDSPVDQLIIAVANDPGTPNGGVVKIAWEKTLFSLPFTVKK